MAQNLNKKWWWPWCEYRQTRRNRFEEGKEEKEKEKSARMKENEEDKQKERNGKIEHNWNDKMQSKRMRWADRISKQNDDLLFTGTDV